MESVHLKKNKKRNITLSSFDKEVENIKKNQKNLMIILFILIVSGFILFIILITYKAKTKTKIKVNNILNNELNSELKNNLYKYAELNKKILEPYIEKQRDFCVNPQKYYNEQIENEIKLQKIIVNDISYEMFIYTGVDIVSKTITIYKQYEGLETINILNALKCYGKKNNIKRNKDIFMLDIGGNIGWYPSFLGRFGYTILTFEPMEKNYYLLRKNFCYINKDSNVIIINKGLSNIEKNCSYYEDIDNKGNGMVLCDGIKNEQIKEEFKKQGEVSLTKLSNFIPYLYDKNLALIKMDIEGSEGKAIEGGIELINEYHVPYILIEFTPRTLIEHGTDPKKFLELFIDNGYHIKLGGFFNQTDAKVNDIMIKVHELINLYFVYEENI